MNAFVDALNEQLQQIHEAGLHRYLREVDSPQGAEMTIEGRRLLNFSSNDYLGLAGEPSLRRAACAAVEQYGAGSGASRLICGSMRPFHTLESALAEYKQTEAALSFSTGYATALGTIGALFEAHDVIILDKRVHACVVDAARLCGAKLRVFVHNDPGSLEKMLRWADAQAREGEPSARRQRTLVVTESVFSMDGDQAPLAEIVRLKDQYGAWLMLDEAHATGIHGPAGRGLAAEMGHSNRVEIQMGTLGKALGAAGGFIAGNGKLVDVLINRARSLIFSTAPVPASAAAAEAGVRLAAGPEGERRREQLWARVSELRAGLAALGWELPERPGAILPLVVGAESEALRLAGALRERGFFVPAIRYPTVARGSARLRITLTADHTSVQIGQLLRALSEIGRTA